jgi:hypothetical protein
MRVKVCPTASRIGNSLIQHGLNDLGSGFYDPIVVFIDTEECISRNEYHKPVVDDDIEK